MSQKIEELLAEQTREIMMKHNHILSEALEEANGDENRALEIYSSKSKTPSEEDMTAMQSSLEVVGEKCKFDENNDTFHGYGANGEILPECREALMTYSGLLKKMMEI